MAPDHGLTPRQVELIRGVLAPFAGRIDRVDLFGSRALGTHRPNSDVDMAIHGRLEEKDADRLWTLFHESALPISVDVKDYARLAHAPLREHVDRAARTLFTREQLLAPS
jgi:predicted nucleotidyltransferase